MLSRETIFLEEGFLFSYQECEENVRSIPSSFRLVPHNLSGIPATLWITMWTECEEFVSLNEDAKNCLPRRALIIDDLPQLVRPKNATFRCLRAMTSLIEVIWALKSTTLE